jgi:hypothetical protein
VRQGSTPEWALVVFAIVAGAFAIFISALR